MLERYLARVATDDSRGADPAAIRERLKGVFSPAFSRRATVLGALIGGVLREVEQDGCEAIVHASAYGETRALADFLDTFPHASPTLFQTSVHPSSVQQVMIDRKRPVPEYLPLAGGPNLAARALLAALLSPADPVVLCGGEEQGTWMTEHEVASDRAFAFALSLRRDRPAGALGRLHLEPLAGGGGGLSFPDWFDILHGRRNFAGAIAPEWRLELAWS